VRLSGFTVCKNALSLDYAIVECINSLLPVCDEVVVGEMGSTDGTRLALQAWSERDSRIRIVDIRDWTRERGNMKWFVEALNETRQHLQYPMMLQLDADEVLGDDRETLALVQRAKETGEIFAFDRLNFARDAKSLIPEGECCGKYVVRIGPSKYWIPSDEPHERGEVEFLDLAHIEPMAKIFHLGFLRHPEAFYAKARVVLGAFFNEFDSRLAAAEREQTDPLSKFEWWNRLERYTGDYPAGVKKWMLARGHSV
jgi:glycosyltransferase involved in cell wall biosynthesis